MPKTGWCALASQLWPLPQLGGLRSLDGDRGGLRSGFVFFCERFFFFFLIVSHNINNIVIYH